MLDFFEQRFRYIHQLNLSWITHLKKDDRDIPASFKLVVSRMINHGHIAVSYLSGEISESAPDDLLPERYWEDLERGNYRQWMALFLQFDQGIKEQEDELIRDLFRVLHEQAQYIGQLKLLSVQHELELFDETLLVVD